MSNETLTAALGVDGRLLADEYWIRLVQLKDEEETATLGEVAELVDDIFELNPCIEPEEEAEESPQEEEVVDPDPPTIVDLARVSDSVKRLFELDLCDMDGECNFLAQVKVIISKPGEQYTLRLAGGKTGKAVITEEIIEKRITVEDAVGVVLDYPVVSGFSASWAGVTIGSGGKVAGPEIVRTGNTLNWGTSLTGTLTVKHNTRYDLVDILVFGVEKDGEYEPGKCRVIGFYHGMMDEIDIEIPEEEGDDVDREAFCAEPGSKVEFPEEEVKPQWVTTKKYFKCQCSGEIDHYKYSNEATAEDVAADEYIFPGIIKDVFGGYVDCGEVTGDINSPVFYEENCCEPPPAGVFLPDCAVFYRRNSGGAEFEFKKEYGELYGERLRLIPVSPADGDCGYTKYVQDLTPRNCCEDIPALVLNSNYSGDIMSPSDTLTICVEDTHSKQLSIKVRGADAWLNWEMTQRDGVTSADCFHVVTGPDACGMVYVYITDGCTSILHEIKVTVGNWIDITSQFNPGDWPTTTSNWEIVFGGNYEYLNYIIGETLKYKMRTPFLRDIFCSTGAAYDCNPSDSVPPATAMDAYTHPWVGFDSGGRCVGSVCIEDGRCDLVTCKYIVTDEETTRNRFIYQWGC